MVTRCQRAAATSAPQLYQPGDHQHHPHQALSGACPQAAVEAALSNASSGVALNPLWFPKYWLGLSTVDDWPYYSWDDGVTPGPDYPTSGKYYRHWGSFQGTAAEPNEAGLCAVADYLEGYSTTNVNQSPPSLTDTNLAWGWNDQHCNMSFPYICQYPPQRESPGTAPAHAVLVPAWAASGSVPDLVVLGLCL